MTLDLNAIRSVVNSVQGASNELLAIIDGLAPLTTRPSKMRLVFDRDNLQIKIGLRGQFTRASQRLEALEPLKLAVAPVVAGLISTEEHDLMVLDYWAIPGEQRLEVGPLQRLDDSARTRFRDDLLRLADAGWMHQYATRGSQYRRIGSKTGLVTLEDWGVVVPVEDKDELVTMIGGLE